MPASRKRLGKGLGALLGEGAVASAHGDEPAERAAGDVRRIAIDRIRPNRYQPRKVFDEEAITELAVSIADKGVLQPLLVTPGEDGWELVSGERRWRAARKAGLDRIPVVVRQVDDREMLEIALIENLQREDLDPIDEAEGYRRLVDEFDLTQGELAEAVGKSRPAIANALRLLDLPGTIRGWVREGRLSAGHARTLLTLKEAAAMEEMGRQAIDRELSVRQVERMVRKAKRAADDEATSPTDPHEIERERLEEEFQRSLGTRVALRANRKGKGTLVIAFYSFDDLERLRARLAPDAR